MRSFQTLRSMMVGSWFAAVALPAAGQQAAARAVPDRSTETPFTVRAELVNGRDIMRALVREYPTELRDAQVGGTVVVDIFIDETGQPLQALIAAPSEALPRGGASGKPALDQAALVVAREMRFSPALNGDVRVGVWVQVPISFRVG